MPCKIYKQNAIPSCKKCIFVYDEKDYKLEKNSDNLKETKYYKLYPTNSVCNGCDMDKKYFIELSKIEKNLLGLE